MMTNPTFTLLKKTFLLSSLSLLALPVFSAEHSTKHTIAELVDAVNGTPDEASRAAGKKVKLRNHAKGFCTSGKFEPNMALQDTLNIPFFMQDEIKVIARFSLGGTNINASDKGSGRFMSLKIDGDAGSINFVTSNAQPFFANNLDDFFIFQNKVKQGAAGKQWLKENKPHAKAFFDYVEQRPTSASFENNRYFGVNSFLFTTQKNDIAPGRWFFEPVKGDNNLSKAELAKMPDDFLKETLLSSIEKEPAVWNLYIKLAQAGDEINDPTIVWPESRQRLLVGQLIINGERDKDPLTQQCGDTIFNPVLLPEGISASADPILNARTPAYVESFVRRL